MSRPTVIMIVSTSTIIIGIITLFIITITMWA
jgi:hypothetical protein